MSWFLYATASAVLFGVYYLLLKKNLSREHVYVYLAIYSTTVFLILLPFLSMVKFPQSNLQWLLIFLEGFSLSLFFTFMTYAYKNLEESEVSPLGNLGILFTIVLSVIIFNEELKLQDFFGFAMMIIGTFILEAGIHISKIKEVLVKYEKHRKYLFYILLGVLFASLSNIIEKIVIDPSSINLGIAATDPFSFNFLTRGFLMVVFLSGALVKKGFPVGFRHAMKNVGLTIIIAAIIYNLANISFFKALSLGHVSHVITIAALSSLFVTVIGGSIFSEHKLKQKIIACIIMILATYLIVS